MNMMTPDFVNDQIIINKLSISYKNSQFWVIFDEFWINFFKKRGFTGLRF